MGASAALDFAQNVSAPYQVGHVLGNIGSDFIESDFLPDLLQNEDEVQRSLIAGFALGRFEKLSWPWVDKLLAIELSVSQKSAFLVLLPFVEEVWTRVEEHLGTEEGLYWRNVVVNPWGKQRDLAKAIEKTYYL